MDLTVERILLVSKQKGVKQTNLENAIGGYRGKVTEWKKGKSSPSIDEIKLLASFLDTSVAYLSGETDDPSPRITVTRDPVELAQLLRDKGILPKDRDLTEAEEKRLLDLLEVAVREYKEED